jgi:hypothetical protein
MSNQTNGNGPIHTYFAAAIHDAMASHANLSDAEVESYLTKMLVEFLRMDGVYGLKNKFGKPVCSVSEMLQEGDIRYNADSFAREREVHRHIGDFLLFWSGLFPEYLPHLKSPTGKDVLLDPVGQGRLSYHVASTFEYEPYSQEAKVLRKLSDKFDTYRYGLGVVRAGFEGFPLAGWARGFDA